jgi:PPOX class probable F420-dependent enzyme
MSEEERREFLAHGTRTGKLATVRKDGRPHVVPVWFVLDGDDMVFTTAAGTVKGKALRRDPRATICVDLQEQPYAYVMVEGEVELSTDLDDMLVWATRIAARYEGEENAERYGARNAVEGEMLVRLRPSNFVAFDFVDD